MTLIPGKSPSKICKIKEGISQCKQGYGAWELHRELSLSDPGQDTKLPLEQRVLHTASPSHLYYKDAYGNLQHYSLYFISVDNTCFVGKIQTLLVEFLKQRLLNITKIYYVSDGCGGQYKNFKNLLNLCSHKEDFSIKTERIFFATSHGKSPCDRFGGAVKRHAAK